MSGTERTQARRRAGAVLPVVVLVAVLLGGSHGAAQGEVPPHRALDVLSTVLLVLAGVLLLARQRAPAVLLVVEAALLAVWLLRDYPHGPAYLPVLFAAAQVAASRPRRTATALVAAVAVPLVAIQLTVRGSSVADRLLLATAMAGAFAVAAVVGTLAHREREARAQARAEIRRREAEEQRLEIAREVHDVVGHGLAVIALQAGVALHVVDRRPEQARLALERIRDASAEALAELRSTLAVFRGPQEAAALAPVAGLSRLPALVAEMRACGLALEVQGSAADLPVAVDTVAFRVVQEACTNVLRHAGAPTARVCLERGDGRVAVTVENDAGVEVPSPGAGHGLRGLRERCEALGGRCDAGPTDAGGWRVTADLPVTP